MSTGSVDVWMSGEGHETACDPVTRYGEEFIEAIAVSEYFGVDQQGPGEVQLDGVID